MRGTPLQLSNQKEQTLLSSKGTRGRDGDTETARAHHTEKAHPLFMIYLLKPGQKLLLTIFSQNFVVTKQLAQSYIPILIGITSGIGYATLKWCKFTYLYSPSLVQMVTCHKANNKRQGP